jgi:hypothetical protein
VFLVRAADGRKFVVKRSDAPWSEAAAAAIGRVAGIRTVRALPFPRSLWSCGMELPYAEPIDEWLLALPWVEAPVLARAPVVFDAQQLGRLWAFDVLIDNSDRLLKGGNPLNILVGGDGSLFAIDQHLGPAVTGEVDAARVTRRRLRGVATMAQRQELGRDLFEDFRREAGVAVPDASHLACAFARGVVNGIRSIALLRATALDQAVETCGARPHVRTPGFSAILRQFEEVAE